MQRIESFETVEPLTCGISIDEPPVPHGNEFAQGYHQYLDEQGITYTSTPYVLGPNGLTNPDGSNIERDIERERDVIKTYLDGQFEDHPTYQRQLAELQTACASMGSDVRIAVAIAAHNESGYIDQTLEQWANSSMSPEQFELNVITNGPRGYTPDDTADRIRVFATRHPHLNVNVMEVELPTEQGNIGLARKLLNDTILARSLDRPLQSGPLYIESGDADIEFVHPNTLAERVRLLDDSPTLDAVAGTRDLSPELLSQHDLMFLSVRASLMTMRLMQVQRLRPESGNVSPSAHNAITTNGWNSAYSAEAYALSGGHATAPSEEDYDLGIRMNFMRGRPDSELPWLTNTMAHTSIRMHASARRLVESFAAGHSLHLYKGFANVDSMAALHTLDMKTALAGLEHARLSEASIPAVADMLQDKQLRFSSFVHDPNEQRHLFGQLTTFLGFGRHDDAAGNSWPDVSLQEDGRVEVHSVDNVRNALAGFRDDFSHAGFAR